MPRRWEALTAQQIDSLLAETLAGAGVTTIYGSIGNIGATICTRSLNCAGSICIRISRKVS